VASRLELAVCAIGGCWGREEAAGPLLRRTSLFLLFFLVNIRFVLFRSFPIDFAIFQAAKFSALLEFAVKVSESSHRSTCLSRFCDTL
jgi:hypothetical protein